jgi:hypothetical protein
MREMYCGYVRWRVLYSERGDYEREEEVTAGFVVGCIPSFFWMIIKKGPGNLSGGRSPHWVNHINLCLSCIVYLLCFVSAFVLFYCSAVLFF